MSAVAELTRPAAVTVPEPAPVSITLEYVPASDGLRIHEITDDGQHGRSVRLAGWLWS